MRTFLLAASIVCAALPISAGLSKAATLDDVMARLEGLQRDNQAMRREIESLRKNVQPTARVIESHAKQTPGSPTNAMAADMPSQSFYKASPHAPYSWSGFYAGVNAGYGFGNEATSIVAPSVFSFIGSADTDGFFGGGQVGYNLQLGYVVLGIEADLQFADIGGSRHLVGPVPGGAFAANTLESFATARGRVALAFDRFLPYFTGGFAAGRNSIATDTGLATAADVVLHTGWVMGAGIEYGIRDGWTVKAEYLHVNLGSQDYLNGSFGANVVTNVDLQFDLVRAGLNYRF